ncbi:MAG: transporter substrate-binding domain-containing protein [Acidimicrobiales bacterium]
MQRREFLTLSGKVGAGVLLIGPLGAIAEACSGTSATTAPTQGPSASGAPAGSASGEDTLARAQRQGYITLGFNNNKPLSYVDPATGLPTGSGPTVLTKVLNNLGIPKVKYTVVDFAGIIPGLLSKQWDLSGIAFYLTPDRCNQVAFTNPVNQYVEGALVKSGNPLSLHSYADMAKSGAKVAIQEGDAEVPWAKAAGITPVLFPQEPLAVEALKQGRVDCYLNSTFALRADMANYGGQGIELAAPFTGPLVNGQPAVFYAGFACRYEDVSLLNALDQQIVALNKSGELLTLQSPYGFTAETNPAVSVTGKSVCPAAPWPSGYQSITG